MSRTTVAILLPLFLLTVSVSPVIAENDSTNTGKKPSQERIEKKASAAANLKAQKEAAREDFKAKMQAAKETFEQNRETAKEQFKARLEKIKDENKKVVAERLEENFNTINKKMTEHFSSRLEKFTNFLARIETRKDKLALEGKSVASVESAITLAEAAIATAETAVATQEAKTYTIQFTSESNLKTGAGTTQRLLRADLKAVQDKVVAARKAVGDALRSLETATGTTASGSAEVND